MKKSNLSITLLLTLVLLFSSCDNFFKSSELEDFCNLSPSGWTYELISQDFNLNDIPKNAPQPIAIIKYINLEKTFDWAVDIKINPSLILDFYPIEQKEELWEFIKSQQYFSWCIPEYFGETNKYFIITSPCFKNSGVFTDEANRSAQDLHRALEKLITRKN